jgi:hypothetical protein
MTDNNQQQAIDYFITLNMSGHPGHKLRAKSHISDSTHSTKSSTISLQTTNNDGLSLGVLYPNPAQINTTVSIAWHILVMCEFQL